MEKRGATRQGLCRDGLIIVSTEIIAAAGWYARSRELS